MADNLEPTADGVPEAEQLGPRGRILLGCGLVLLLLALNYLLAVLWPSGLSSDTNGAQADQSLQRVASWTAQTPDPSRLARNITV